MGEAKQRTAGADKEQADPAAIAPQGLTVEAVQKMIDDAIEAALDKPIASLDVPKMVADALPLVVADAINKIDFSPRIITALDDRERLLAEAAEAEQRATSDAAVAEQRKASAAARSAAKAAESAEETARKKRSAAIDRAQREYGQLFEFPVPSALDFADAESIILRFGDGKTFLPEFELVDIPPSALADDGGRPALSLDVIPGRDLVPFQATEAILLVEGGKEPVALWRADILPPAPVGGGNETVFPSGSLAFRRVSPLPAAATA